MTTKTHSADGDGKADAAGRHNSSTGIAPVLWAVGLLGVAASAAGFAWVGWFAGLSVAIGASLGAANLWLLARVVTAFLEPTAPQRPLVLLTLIKFAALFGGVFALARLGAVDILALGVGFGMLPLGIVLGQFKAPAIAAREGN